MSQPPTSVGWDFARIQVGTTRQTPIRFSVTGNYSFDTSRDVVRSISGFALLPEDREEIDFSSDQVLATLILDEVRYPMGRFVFVEDVEQKDVVLHPATGDLTDITNVALGDNSTLLIRNTGAPESLYSGFNATFELERIVSSAGLHVSVESGESSGTQTVTWDGTTTDLTKVRQLAEIAGHAAPWSDNTGVIRSVLAARILGQILQFEKDIFIADKGSVSVTNNYLTIPNRVIVSSASAGAQIVGVWDAPSSWPSSEARRGYVRAMHEEVQGLATNTDAQRVAASIGKRLSARRMTAKIMPTAVLDGPRVLEYKGSLWTVQNWSGSTGPGSVFDIEAEELFVEEDFLAAPHSVPGVI